MVGGIRKPVDGSVFWRGPSRSRVLTVAAVAVILALGLFAQPVAAVTTSITLTPNVGPPTTKVTVTGAGFGVSETVKVYFSAAQVATLPSTITTTSTGTFTASFTVPKTALPGSYPVKATGTPSGLSATYNFLVRTDWARFHFDPANSGYNPYENTLAPANVSGLKPAWTASPAIASVGSSPAVAGGVVYVLSTNGKLYAYSADGTTGCTGTPPTKTCPPLWTGTAGVGSSAAVSSPTVAGGVVYVGSGYNLYAFTAGTSPSNCSGTPKTCPPLWTAATNFYVASAPVVAGGVVYVTSRDNNVYAFNAGTSPSNCTKTSASGSGSSVTYMSNNLTDTSKSWLGNQWTNATVSVNGGAEMGIASRNDAHTITLAAPWSGGTPTAGSAYRVTITTCPALWKGPVTGGNTSTSPAVAGGVGSQVVYVGSGYHLYAFNAGTSPSNCYGTPPMKTCPPLWTAATDGISSSAPAAVGGVVYIGAGFSFYAFNAGTSPSNCTKTSVSGSGSSVTYMSNNLTDTSKSWLGNQWTNATVSVNGGAEMGIASKNYAHTIILAAPWSGGTPTAGSAYSVTITTCPALWTGGITSGATGIQASPAVANGFVYESSSDGKLYAFTAGSNPPNCFITGTPHKKTCPALWTAAGGGGAQSSPAVADGVVYSGNSGQYLYAFSASGTTKCTKTNVSGSGSGVTYGSYTLADTSKSWLGNQWINATVSVNGGAEMGIASRNDAHTITLAALWGGGTPTAGSAYSVTITTCDPLGTMKTGSNKYTYSSPAVANGMVYIGTWYGAGLYAFGL
jgi:outer membrane protein assembly factor BamB